MAGLMAGALPILATGLQVVGSISAGQEERQSYDYQAAMLRQQAGEETAVASAKAANQRRLGLLTLERAQAISGGSGSDPNSPSVLNIEGNIAGQTEYNSATALYNGKAVAQQLGEQAAADEYSGKLAANAGILRGISAGLNGAMTFASKYGEGTGGDGGIADVGGMPYYTPPVGYGADINSQGGLIGGGYAQGY